MLNAHCFIKDHFVPFALSYRLVWVNLDPPKEPTEPLRYTLTAYKREPNGHVRVHLVPFVCCSQSYRLVRVN